ncbi:MAG: YceI family protein [Bacteroidales bacterium]|nr:YceI family protein [Bacteroidales bacterium]
MKKLTLVATVAISVILFAFTVVTSTTWTYDKNHAKVGFTVTHMMISDVEGYFKTANVTLTTTKDDFTDAVVEMTAEAASINTDNEKRDGHLQSADFFDVAQFPTLTFKSTSFKKTKTPNTYVVKGNLTMHGVTKPVTLSALAKTGTNPMSKKNIVGFKITGQLKRSDFGIGGGTPSAIVSDEVLIDANAEFIKN